MNENIKYIFEYYQQIKTAYLKKMNNIYIYIYINNILKKNFLSCFY